jgi:hypothetical protein
VTGVCIVGSGIVFAFLFNLSKKIGLFKRLKKNLNSPPPKKFQIIRRLYLSMKKKE